MNSFGWQGAFELGSYACVLCCFYYVWQEHRKDNPNNLLLVSDSLVLVFFLYAFHALESWAYFRTPVFYYSDPQFLGFAPLSGANDAMVWLDGYLDRFDIHIDPHHPDLRHRWTACNALVESRHSGKIPFAVPCMEAAIAYCGLATARLLQAPMWRWGLMSGLVALVIDLILDPAVATNVSCTGEPRYSGIGVWNWVGSEPGWYGVPLWNFAVWFAAPVVAAGLAYTILCVLRLARSLWSRSTASGDKQGAVPTEITSEKLDDRAPLRGLGISLVMSLIGVVLIVIEAHDNPIESRFKLGLLFGFAALVVAARIMWSARLRHSLRVRWSLVASPLFLMLFPLAYTLFSGIIFEAPPNDDLPAQTREALPMAFALVSGFALLALGSFFSFAPFLGNARLRSLSTRFQALNGLMRIHYFGWTSSVVMLSAGSASTWANGTVELESILVTAILFHLFMSLHNNWIDFDLDSHDPRRQGDWQQQVGRKRGQLLTLSLVSAALAVPWWWYCDGSWRGLLLLTVAYAAMAFYNAKGKTFRLRLRGSERAIPLFTDIVQAASWVCLSLYSFHLTAGELPLVSWWVASTFAVSILILNGVHGPLRDLINDFDCGRVTTPIWAGARPSGEGPGDIRVSERLRNLAYTYYLVHVVLLAILCAYVAKDIQALVSGWVVLVLAMLVASARLVKLLMRERNPNRARHITQHALVILVSPMVILLPSFDAVMASITVVVFALPFVAIDPTLERLAAFLDTGWEEIHGDAGKSEP